ncbi:MmgE/PrpD family protein [uncultured Castellaniella sp.]|mgnify:CR=1 FL=1|uniref:MmgE/PrpD family protein n=1 Tax=uncultured Castellaniella sp. TaxID=647907 RepID=UPI00263156CA|nr:MmgE/PrpD family protein [uncultured Castellaniella sp.]
MSGGGPMPGLTSFLAQRALAIRPGDVPDDVYAIARHALLDWAALAMASWRLPAVRSLSGYLMAPAAPAGEATVLGAGLRTSPEAAALLNGIAGHALDFDDAHLPSRVHPSAPLWPAILAYGESARLPGERLLAAFAVGVEVQSRLAAGMGESHYRLGWHNTATLGSFGATAAVGWLRGLSPAQLCSAFAIAATMAGGLRAVFGTPAKPLQVARAAANGLFAAGLAQTGFEVGGAVLDGENGFPALYAEDASAGKPMAQPDRWCVREIVFKHHASCYGTQAPIEAALAFGRLDREAVSSVTVYVEPQYLTVCNIAEPETATQAKFSLRHTVALALAGEDTAVRASFEPEGIRKPEVAGWRPLIEVRADPDLPRANARVAVAFASGELQARAYDASRPESDLGRQQDRLLQKTRSLLLQEGFGGDRVAGLQDALLAVRESADMARWMKDFREASHGPARDREHDIQEGA